MLRFLARWYISRTIDTSQSLPAWVQSRLSKDLALRQFYDQSRRLAASLRSTAPEPLRFVAISAPMRSKEPVRSTFGFASVAFGLAALILLMIVPMFRGTGMRSGSQTVGVDSSKSVAHSESVDVEPDQMSERELDGLIGASHVFANSFNQSAIRIVQPLIDAEEYNALLDMDFENVLQPVSEIGTNYGAVLSELDQQIERENQQLISDGIVAWRFFAYQLPKSAASLAGW